MHPLCLTILRRPDLVVNHLSAYTALLAKEASDASRTIVNHVLIWIMVVVFGCIGLGLAGIALMLGVLQNQFHWILVAVPGAMMLCSIIALACTKKAVLSGFFSNIKSQFFSDAQAIRVAAGHEAK